MSLLISDSHFQMMSGKHRQNKLETDGKHAKSLYYKTEVHELKLTNSIGKNVFLYVTFLFVL